MYLFFDTETTGFPDYNSPLVAPKQPHMIQLACVLTDERGREMGSYKTLIDIPKDVTIDEAGRAFEVNKISNADLNSYGTPMRTALSVFRSFEARAQVKIAYNYRFDGFLLKIAHARNTFAATHPPIEKYDPCIVMRDLKNRGMLPNAKLTTAYTFVTGNPPINAHDAMGDVRMMIDVFFYIRKIGMYQPQPRKGASS